MKIVFVFFGLVLSFTSTSQEVIWSQKMSETVINKWPVGNPFGWNYEQGLILRAVETVWARTQTPTYYNYIKGKTDYFVNNAGTINTYDLTSYNLDNIASGRALHFLYKQTGLDKYKLAADKLRSQLASQPRTSDGGFWHKQVYPYQMWLDGLFMAEPFYAEYASLYEQNALRDVAKQFILIEQHARDTTTGLLYHGWNENKAQAWANPITGCSPNVWGRAMGWYAMGLVDVIEFFPNSSAERDSLLAIWQRLALAITNYQDVESGLWYQVMDKQDSIGNYEEASASCMFVYALAKAARLGYSDGNARVIAQKAYEGILSTFVVTDVQGKAHLNGTCPVAGLGGTPYRDGSYGYYVGVKPIQDDAKGMGAFILAAVEMELPSNSLDIETATINGRSIRLYPNPAQNDIYVTVDEVEAWLELRDMFGQAVFSGKGNHVSLHDLSTGLYVLEVTVRGEKSQFKVVKGQ